MANKWFFVANTFYLKVLNFGGCVIITGLFRVHWSKSLKRNVSFMMGTPGNDIPNNIKLSFTKLGTLKIRICTLNISLILHTCVLISNATCVVDILQDIWVWVWPQYMLVPIHKILMSFRIYFNACCICTLKLVWV